MATTNSITPDNRFYQVTIQIISEDDHGKPKKIKEIHLVDAIDPTDVQAKVTKEMEGMVSEWEIISITVSKIGTVY